jgi:ABC-type hemin transport system ATPase subunit
VADELVLLQHGRVRAAGEPGQVLVDDVLTEVYEIPVRATTDPASGRLRVDAVARHHQARATTPGPDHHEEA